MKVKILKLPKAQNGTKIPTNHFQTDKTAFIDSTINANTHMPWVRDLYNPNISEDKQISLASGEADDKNYVFPSHVDLFNSIDNNTAIPFESEEKAQYFANNAYTQKTPLPEEVLKQRFPKKQYGGKADNGANLPNVKSSVTPQMRDIFNKLNINSKRNNPNFNQTWDKGNQEMSNQDISDYNKQNPSEQFNPEWIQPIQAEMLGMNKSGSDFARSGSEGFSPAEGFRGDKTKNQQYVNFERQHINSSGVMDRDTNYGKDYASAVADKSYDSSNGWENYGDPTKNINYQNPVKVDQPKMANIVNKYGESGFGKYGITIPQGKDGLYVNSDQGSVEEIGKNSYTGDTIEFNGPKHSEGGIDINYSGKPVEVEGDETGFIDRQGDLNVLGNMVIPNTKIKFKDAGKMIGKVEKKANQLKEKGTGYINNNDPKEKYQSLTHNTGKVLTDAAEQYEKDAATVKEKLADVQNKILDEAHYTGRDPKSVATGYGNKTFKDGGKQKKSMFDPKYNQLVSKSKAYLEKMYPGEDIDIYQASADRPIQSQADKMKKGQSQTTVSLHNAGAARDFHIYRNGKLISNKEHEAYKNSIWKAAEELGLYHLNDAPPSKEDPTPFGNKDPYHISVVKESNDHTAYSRLLKQYPEIRNTPIFKETENYISKSKDPIAQSVYKQIKESYNNKKYYGGDIAQSGKKISNNSGEDPELSTTDVGYVYRPKSKSMSSSDALIKQRRLMDDPDFEEAENAANKKFGKSKTGRFDDSKYEKRSKFVEDYLGKKKKAEPSSFRFDESPTSKEPNYSEFTNFATPTANQDIEKLPISGPKEFNANPEEQLAKPISQGYTGNYKPTYTGKEKPKEKVKSSGQYKNRYGITDMLPQLSAILEQPEPVQGQQYNPQLYSPYSVSFDERVASGQGDFNAAQNQLRNNPAALGAINAQKYNQDSQIRGEEFKVNQGIQNDVTNKNVDLLNKSGMINLQLADTQAERQAKAEENTRTNRLDALTSMSVNRRRMQSENAKDQLYRDLYHYGYTPGQGFDYEGSGYAFQPQRVGIQNPYADIKRTSKHVTGKNPKDEVDTTEDMAMGGSMSGIKGMTGKLATRYAGSINDDQKKKKKRHKYID